MISTSFKFQLIYSEYFERIQLDKEQIFTITVDTLERDAHTNSDGQSTIDFTGASSVTPLD